MDRFWLYAGFTVFVLVMLALDLGVFNRKAHVIKPREAAIWTGVWVGLALLFSVGIYRYMGRQPALEFLTGWLVEKSLSIDNIFVIVLIFGYFAVPARYQHRVLFWGILGALVFRGIMIGAGALLLERFHWILYLFGAFLVFTGIRMTRQTQRAIDPETAPVLRLVRRYARLTGEYHADHFVVKVKEDDGRTRRYLTPLFVVLMTVETTDVVFALDSIPAVFAVTRDPFLVYTSNVFAILGLRSLYFLLADVVQRFHLLKIGLGIVLVFVGGKMLLEDVFKVPIGISLAVIALVIAGSVVASILFPAKTKEEATPVPPREPPPGEGAGARSPHRGGGAMKARSLLLLRVSLGLFLAAWGLDKLVNTEHGVQVSEHFYLGLVSAPALLRAFGAVQVLAGALIVAGLLRRVTYPFLLLVTATTLLAVWKSIIDPLALFMGQEANLVFFASLPIFAAALVLWAFRDEDVHALDARRHPASRATAEGEPHRPTAAIH